MGVIVKAINILRHYAHQTHPERADDALAVLSTISDDIIPVLLEGVTDQDRYVRILVLEMLDAVPPDDRALPAIINALGDPDRTVRVCAIGPLVRFGVRARHAVPALRKWLDIPDDDWIVTVAAWAIARIAPEQVEEMVDVLIGNIEKCPPSAVERIGDLGPAGIGALPVLLDLLDHESSATRLATAEAIWKITGDPTDFVSVSRNLLASDEWLDRVVGAESLGLLGEIAVEALPDLRLLLFDENVVVRSTVEKAIVQIEAAI